MPAGSPIVSVVVPARDAAGLLGACLDALAAQRGVDPFEVIVVDNGSRDATADVAERHDVRPRVLRRRRGDGPGAARNAGAAAASAPVLAFTDADCRPYPGWLAAGLAAIEDADLVQGAVVADPSDEWGPFAHLVRVDREYGLYESASLFVRRTAFERAGGFEDVVRTGDGRPFGEDTLFAWRLRRGGGRTVFSREAAVSHAVIPGDWRGYLRERRRDGAFAQLARLVPELRGRFFFGRWFFSRRSAAFHAALAGVAVAATRRSALPLAAGVPYLALVGKESRVRTGVVSKRVAAVVMAGDAVGCLSLLRGSLAARTPLL